MNDFNLDYADKPQPVLLDEDPVNDKPWPLPPVRKWAPIAQPTLLERARKLFERTQP